MRLRLCVALPEQHCPSPRLRSSSLRATKTRSTAPTEYSVQPSPFPFVVLLVARFWSSQYVESIVAVPVDVFHDDRLSSVLYKRGMPKECLGFRALCLANVVLAHHNVA